MDYKKLYTSFYNSITQVDRIVIVPHKNPDGDSIGASLGLFNLLRRAGKSVHIILPNRFPLGFEWLPNSDVCIDFENNTQQATDILKACELLIFVDFNSIKRLEKLAAVIESLNIRKIMVDHHPYPDDIANIQISNTAVSSTCELTFDAIRNTPLIDFCNEVSAECFYTGIMTDTGALNHNSSRKETYQIVGELLNYGIDKEKIHRLIFHSNTIERFRLMGHIFTEKLDLLPQCNAAIIALSINDLAKYDYVNGDTEGFSNLPLGIKDINISVFILEKDDRVKISFRSRGSIAVNEFAKKFFGGGGHLNAAGAESTLSFNEVVSLLKREIPLFFTSNTTVS